MVYGWQGLRDEVAINYIYNDARFYSPSLFVFISQDPKGFGGGFTNLYMRTGDAPVNLLDPTGKWIWIPVVVVAVWLFTPEASNAPSQEDVTSGRAERFAQQYHSEANRNGIIIVGAGALAPVVATQLVAGGAVAQEIIRQALRQLPNVGRAVWAYIVATGAYLLERGRCLWQRTTEFFQQNWQRLSSLFQRVPERVEATIHGAQRLADASRLSEAEILWTKQGHILRQADGAVVYIRQVAPDKFNFAVFNERTGLLITDLRHASTAAVRRIALNYGWTTP
jgi:RHS repeat-associated protein